MNKSYLETVVKQSNNAVYCCNQEGHIILWNPGAEKIYGYQEDEALQMKIWSIIPEELHKESEALLNNIMNGGEVSALPVKRITKNGKIADVLFSASAIHPANSIQTIVITEEDITQHKIKENETDKLRADLHKCAGQLEKSNLELESFSYSVSHDLRAPLRALSGYAKIIEEDYSQVLDKEILELLKKIKTNAKRMGQLIDGLLTYSGLGKKSAERRKINMNRLVVEVISELCSSQPHQASIHIDTLVNSEADIRLLYQVWLHLINNAIKYSSKKPDPQIYIGSYYHDDEIVYFVKDNGVGFNMNYANKLFGVFQQLHTPKEFEGTGVGLAIVQRIVAKHDGKVWAEAKVNEGATFFFSIPKLTSNE